MNATDDFLSQSSLTRHLVWTGFRQMVPIAAFVLVFGAAFGLAATQQGLGTAWTVLMSTAVFAGAAQFAVLDLWGPQVPLLPLVLTVFAINARHLLMGATLYPWLRQLTPGRRYGVMALASDSNWALTMQALGRGQPGLGLLLGGGLALWVFWIVGTVLGTQVGSLIANARRWGLDMVMGCFLLAMVVGGEKNLRMLLIWVVAAGASLAAFRWLPENSHVVTGTLTGGLLGLLWTDEEREPSDGH